MRYMYIALLIPLLWACKAKKVVATSTNTVSTATAPKTALEKQLGFALPATANKALYTHVANWLGTPYSYGAKTKAGTDCSGFAMVLYTDVYKKAIPRSTKDQYADTTEIDKADLTEGDLVFFNTTGKIPSHVGVYLFNNKFAHASSSKGVIVSLLTEPYWQKAYIGARRVK